MTLDRPQQSEQNISSPNWGLRFLQIHAFDNGNFNSALLYLVANHSANLSVYFWLGGFVPRRLNFEC